MILIDFFSEAACKGTELIEGWYFYADDDDSSLVDLSPMRKPPSRRLSMDILGETRLEVYWTRLGVYLWKNFGSG